MFRLLISVFQVDFNIKYLKIKTMKIQETAVNHLELVGNGFWKVFLVNRILLQ